MGRRLALVTGASAGIGAAFAEVYARRGYDLALTARRLDRLEQLAGDLAGRFGVEAVCLQADLADPDSPARLAGDLAARGLAADALINNAGYGLPERYLDLPWESQAAFIQVMVTAPSALAHRLAPGMAARGFGRIINVASLAGLVPGAVGSTLYAASKAYLIRFSQSLNLEMRGRGVHVSALCPGFTYSEFHDVTGSRAQVSRAVPRWGWMSAEAVAEAGYAAVEANRAVAVPGLANKAAFLLARLVPEGLGLEIVGRHGEQVRPPPLERR
jgi:short-subunit dehydrogenase